MEDQYLEKVGEFYNEKLLFLTKKTKHQFCDGCTSEKVFKETNQELIFSCGGENECGIQIKITFPEYIHYETQMKELYDEMNRDLNWTVIQNYIDVEEELKSQQKKKQELSKAIDIISDLFYEKNINAKRKLLQTFYKNRVEKTKRCNNLIKSLKSNMPDIEKTPLRKEYVTLVKEMQDEYIKAKGIVQSINPYLQTKPPKVEIMKDSVVKQPTKPVKTKKSKKILGITKQQCIIISLRILMILV